jgi:hypothetical protein
VRVVGKGVVKIATGDLEIVSPSADAALDFGVVPKKTTKDVTISVTNNGALAVDYAVEVASPGVVFRLLDVEEGTLGAGGTVTLTVRFRPWDLDQGYVAAFVIKARIGAPGRAAITLFGREGRPKNPLEEGQAGE